VSMLVTPWSQLAVQSADQLRASCSIDIVVTAPLPAVIWIVILWMPADTFVARCCTDIVVTAPLPAVRVCARNLPHRHICHRSVACRHMFGWLQEAVVQCVDGGHK